MFLLPLPFSEIICFLSMFLTTIYLLVGTIGTIHVQHPPERQDKITIVQEDYAIKSNYILYVDYQVIPNYSKPITKIDFSYCNFAALKIHQTCCWEYLVSKDERIVYSHITVVSSRGPPTAEG